MTTLEKYEALVTLGMPRRRGFTGGISRSGSEYWKCLGRDGWQHVAEDVALDIMTMHAIRWWLTSIEPASHKYQHDSRDVTFYGPKFITPAHRDYPEGGDSTIIYELEESGHSNHETLNAGRDLLEEIIIAARRMQEAKA